MAAGACRTSGRDPERTPRPASGPDYAVRTTGLIREDGGGVSDSAIDGCFASVPASKRLAGEIHLDATEKTVAMPPQRPRFERVQLNTRVRVEIEQMLQRFVVDHNTTVQSSVDLALAEFLAARGYPLPAADDGRNR
ncbi:hypothetical protein GCM10007977_015550 [Dactylosporangium sucinum]|uniref:Uncharacterized protein n=1 Tax=Dactylosporangium sucinum TaxID=1424081 RepID=A0A917T9Y6_9ACTN|nr:hypothetical protein GCM10007977_015550 [Dactylosporangium sucinum]